MPESDASKTLIPHVEHVVDFYGDQIPVALVGDIPYVALRTFADYLGLAGVRRGSARNVTKCLQPRYVRYS